MAVYTEVSADELDAFLAQYDIGSAESFKGVAEGVENSNYFLTTDRGTYFVTLYEKRVDPTELPYFLGLMEHLALRGLACPTPVLDHATAITFTVPLKAGSVNSACAYPSAPTSTVTWPTENFPATTSSSRATGNSHGRPPAATQTSRTASRSPTTPSTASTR